MVKVEIKKSEIEKMLKEQFDCDKVEWSEDGVIIELNIDQLKEKEEKIKEIHHHHHHDSCKYPFYYDMPKRNPYRPSYWCANSGNLITFNKSNN